MSERIPCSRSRQSGKLVFPAVASGSAAAPFYDDASVENRAALYSFTTIHPNPKSGKSPFSLVYADFADSLRVFGKLDPDGGVLPEIGMALRMEMIDPAIDGELPYLFVQATQS